MAETKQSENIETLQERIFLLSITGEVEGHESLGGAGKDDQIRAHSSKTCNGGG